MVVEADKGEENSFATLQSPSMHQSSADCTLHFYYHMYGKGMDVFVGSYYNGLPYYLSDILLNLFGYF